MAERYWNGQKVHPLSGYAIAALRQIAGPGVTFPYQINPGVRNRLRVDELIEEYSGLGDPKLRLTDAGKKVLDPEDKVG